jgi:hypothetical protein
MEQVEEIKRIDKRRKYSEGYKENMRVNKYHTKYYHENNQTTKCPICNKETTTRALNQHQKSVKCLLIKNNIVLK